LNVRWESGAAGAELAAQTSVGAAGRVHHQAHSGTNIMQFIFDIRILQKKEQISVHISIQKSYSSHPLSENKNPLFPR
jgi:hypothetical protein